MTSHSLDSLHASMSSIQAIQKYQRYPPTVSLANHVTAEQTYARASLADLKPALISCSQDAAGPGVPVAGNSIGPAGGC